MVIIHWVVHKYQTSEFCLRTTERILSATSGICTAVLEVWLCLNIAMDFSYGLDSTLLKLTSKWVIPLTFSSVLRIFSAEVPCKLSRAENLLSADCRAWSAREQHQSQEHLLHNKPIVLKTSQLQLSHWLQLVLLKWQHLNQHCSIIRVWRVYHSGRLFLTLLVHSSSVSVFKTKQKVWVSNDESKDCFDILFFFFFT